MRAALIGAAAVATAVVASAFGQGDERAGLPRADPVDLPHCSPMMHRGEERPDVLIAASTSLQGRGAEYGVQGMQAMKLVLEERGWRAGQFGVGLQICDEISASRGLTSPGKCRSSARAFARNRSVVGVVGPMHSDCATEMLPSLNRAPGGPLVLVAPTATYVGLTRTAPGAAGADPDWYLPTGRRSFVRLLPADDVQGAAGAVFAKRAGAESVYALNGCDCAYGLGVAGAFQHAAARIGLRVAGSGQWSAYASGYRALAERIRGTGADAVYLGGYLENNGVRLIRDLRSVLGPGVVLLAPDGFASPAPIVEGAGPAAEGFTVTFAGLPNGELPATGRAFADRFEKRYLSRPRSFSMHTAQAAHVLLDAIGDSDGGRADVTERVLRTRVEDGLLGDFEFDRYGDTTLNAIGVYRIEEGRMRLKTVISTPAERIARR
jgi:branched-chain amino acid transport system substrate-binding protein